MTGKRGVRWIQPTSGPAKILDHLESDGGWFTAERMAMATGLQLLSTRRALIRLRSRGLVESRPRPGARNLDWRLRGESPMYAYPARYT